MASALIDNDVLYKSAVYGLLDQLLTNIPLSINHYGMLGSAKYIIRKRLAESPPARGADSAVSQFNAAIAAINEIEPLEGEVAFAASLELAAQQANLDLDVGESLLCAVLTNRGKEYLLTGDKRAIVAMQKLQEIDLGLVIEHNIVCLEQLFCWLIDDLGLTMVRTAVCSEDGVDKSLTICFSCSRRESTLDNCRAGLESYIGSLRKQAPDVLISES